jgi:hypothetical protein
MSELTCKSCKHAFRPLSSLPIWGSGAEWRCRKAFVPETVEQDVVRGPQKVQAHYQRCMTARGSYSDAVCGKNGKLWEPKSKKYFFLAIKHSER